MKAYHKFFFKRLPEGYYRKFKCNWFKTSSDGVLSNQKIGFYYFDANFVVDRVSIGFGVLLWWVGVTFTMEMINAEKELYYRDLHDRYKAMA